MEEHKKENKKNTKKNTENIIIVSFYFSSVTQIELYSNMNLRIRFQTNYIRADLVKIKMEFLYAIQDQSYFRNINTQELLLFKLN